MFEDESLADKATMAVEKQIHQGDDGTVGDARTEKGPVVGEEIRERNLV